VYIDISVLIIILMQFYVQLLLMFISFILFNLYKQTALAKRYKS